MTLLPSVKGYKSLLFYAILKRVCSDGNQEALEHLRKRENDQSSLIGVAPRSGVDKLASTPQYTTTLPEGNRPPMDFLPTSLSRKRVSHPTAITMSQAKRTCFQDSSDTGGSLTTNPLPLTAPSHGQSKLFQQRTTIMHEQDSLPTNLVSQTLDPVGSSSFPALAGDPAATPRLQPKPLVRFSHHTAPMRKLESNSESILKAKDPPTSYTRFLNSGMIDIEDCMERERIELQSHQGHLRRTCEQIKSIDLEKTRRQVTEAQKRLDDVTQASAVHNTACEELTKLVETLGSGCPDYLRGALMKSQESNDDHEIKKAEARGVLLAKETQLKEAQEKAKAYETTIQSVSRLIGKYEAKIEKEVLIRDSYQVAIQVAELGPSGLQALGQEQLLALRSLTEVELQKRRTQAD
ncbi:hypothetical protein FSARC_2693 [Fusarium sarcochroum]|uniref:Uncharacterized protein n=1 Tax=Fusarium sarcochroum TaxID=1208366 RepID=A0A8H4U5M5_9HYPO|nr:hypothetical protein FSARC_2693 [Fusarium sarcochroum]